MSKIAKITKNHIEWFKEPKECFFYYGSNWYPGWAMALRAPQATVKLNFRWRSPRRGSFLNVSFTLSEMLPVTVIGFLLTKLLVVGKVKVICLTVVIWSIPLIGLKSRNSSLSPEISCTFSPLIALHQFATGFSYAQVCCVFRLLFWWPATENGQIVLLGDKESDEWVSNFEIAYFFDTQKSANTKATVLNNNSVACGFFADSIFVIAVL
jgi:hypothetical protein